MKYLILPILFLVSFAAHSQNTNNIWYFGDGNFLDFNASMANPVLTGSGVEIATATSTYCQEGSSTVCDAAGNLLFYNSSEQVWDQNYNQMPNGFGLIGSSSTSAQTLAVPKPGSADIYYIFHMDFAATVPNPGLYYTEVDMSLNGGLGDVTANKNISMVSGACSEQLKAVTHCNGTDIWIISHSETGNTFNCYLVDATGVSTTAVTTSIGNNYPSSFSGMSYMTCSKDGSQVAVAGDMGGVPAVEVFSFDNLNGTFCNPLYLPTPDIASSYGVEFSADGTKLYSTGYKLHQYDFTTSTWFTYAPTEIGGALMRGPNDKIYLVAGCDYYDAPAATMYYARDIHVIATPNLAGLGATLQMNAYLTPRECGLGLPTCYYPTQTTNTCSPMDAFFTADNSTVCEGDCVNFTDGSSGASIVSYQWTFAGGTPSTFTGSTPPTICYATQGTYTASLLVIDCAGTNSIFTMDIEVIDCSGPQPDFQADQTQFCVGGCINYTDLSTGTNVNSWDWSFPGGTPSTSNLQNPTNVCYGAVGSYDVTLTVIDDNGTNTITFPNYIVVDACIPPVADFIAPDTVCEGSCMDFIDASLNSPTQWDWTLNGATPGSSTDQNPLGVCFNTPGLYTLELIATNAYGTDTYSKDILVLSTPNAGNDVVLSWCETEVPQNLELLLDPGVPTSGTWLNPQSTPAFSGTTFSPQLDVAGTYTILYVLTNLICSDTMEFIIDSQGAPYAGIDGTLTICDNDSPVDLIGVLGGGPDLNGTWSPSLASGTSVFDPSIDPDGVYTYTIPQSLACSSDSSKATVTITYVATVEIVPVGDLCSTSSELNLESNIGNGTWTGTGIVNGANGLFDPSIAGAGVHTVTYTLNLDNCTASVSSDIIITDLPTVDLGDDLINCISDPLSLQVNSGAGDVVTWWDGSVGNAISIDFQGYSAGETMLVEVQVENLCGISSDAISIELIDCDVYVYVPNSFTPDGNEFNQLFLPVLTGDNITDYEFLIFNRWGELVFQSNDLNEGWDGTYQGGIVQNGMYTWKLIYTNSANQKTDRKEMVGHVSLLH